VSCKSTQEFQKGIPGPQEKNLSSKDTLKPDNNKSPLPKINGKKSKEKVYADIITSEAVSDTGLFTVHRVDEKWYYNIDDEMMGKDMLLVTRIVQTPANLSPFLNAGSKTNEQVVRWEKKGKKVILKTISFNNVASDTLPIYKSVQYNNMQPIIASFDIACLNADSSGVIIDVTSLFSDDVTAISGLNTSIRKRYKVSRLDKTRSFIDTIRSYPINVEVIQTMTFNASEPPSNARTGTITMQMNQSMILLPEDKMMPRLHDSRVGWFTTSQIDYSSEALKSDVKTYIRRWRLEPKDKEAYLRGELVEPVKPIVYYLDPATPLKWRPYFRQGIEDWQDAFEYAGFKNAIIAKDPPGPEEDPEFSPEDARYSTVRYVASTTRNAVGPSVSDPRTGEIIESDIIWYHNHLRSYRNRYLIETGAANPKARTLDTPEEEIGEMMRRVISHEIGHALGLPHNMKASSAYPTDSLRSGSFSQKYGIATTIMDYARFNYVAQPGDEGIRFIRQLGPYDYYAIEYGYRWYPNIDAPENEKEILHNFVTPKSSDPMYMFGGGFPAPDPNSQTECVGDDAVKASTYGISNLKIVAANLLNWTSQSGEGYGDLTEIYGEMVGIWSRYLGHVVTNIGGVYETIKTADQSGVIYEPVPGSVQRNAASWLISHAFETPDWMLDNDLVQRITYSGAMERIRSTQERHLGSLLSESRINRMIEAQGIDGDSAYPARDFVTDITNGLWSELYSRKNIDPVRRSLQRTYLKLIDGILSDGPAPRSFGPATYSKGMTDAQAIVKSALKKLRTDIARSIRRMPKPMDKDHLSDCLDRIDDILDNEND
jgi:hypothetical protein